ncbi:expressed unknown protein [Seminavis robusta]|uniref:Uncharacterized protein n=1 Tax=Seminavis robusta TaxID=568900 RepID=A0A9N8EF20_9STRA|nr:expressed unknown protein [Seminavis robusta]|eukprot:Sro1028_g233190.1 n/a (642) ;mRNA; f:31856-33892
MKVDNDKEKPSDVSVEGEGDKSQASSIGKRLKKITSIFSKKKNAGTSAGNSVSANGSKKHKKSKSKKGKKGNKKEAQNPEATKDKSEAAASVGDDDAKDADVIKETPSKPVVLESHYYETTAGDEDTESEDDEECNYSAPAALGIRDEPPEEEPPSSPKKAEKDEKEENVETPNEEDKDDLDVMKEEITSNQNEATTVSTGADEVADAVNGSLFCCTFQDILFALHFSDAPGPNGSDPVCGEASNDTSCFEACAPSTTCVPTCGPTNAIKADGSFTMDDSSVSKPKDEVDGPSPPVPGEAKAVAGEVDGDKPVTAELQIEVETPTDAPADTADEKSGEASAEKAAEDSAEKAAADSADASSPDKPAEPASEAPVDSKAEAPPAEAAPDAPEKSAEETPAEAKEAPSAVPTETPAETPDEAPKTPDDAPATEPEELVLTKQPTPSGMTNDDETAAASAAAKEEEEEADEEPIKVETVGVDTVDESVPEKVEEVPSVMTEQRDAPEEAESRKSSRSKKSKGSKWSKKESHSDIKKTPSSPKKLSRREAQQREQERMKYRSRHVKNLHKDTGRDEIERARNCDSSTIASSPAISFDLMANDSMNSEKSTLDAMIQDALKRIDRAKDYVDMNLQSSMSVSMSATE